jgi:nucleoside 2-deoxyribosyltransferase
LFERIGYKVLDPWKLTDQTIIDRALHAPEGPVRQATWREVNTIIGNNNVEAINLARIVVGVLDGTDVDSGTASEIGYAYARSKLIIGYRGDFRLSSDNSGAMVNLQVEYFIRKSGGTIVATLAKLEEILAKKFREFSLVA